MNIVSSIYQELYGIEEYKNAHLSVKLKIINRDFKGDWDNMQERMYVLSVLNFDRMTIAYETLARGNETPEWSVYLSKQEKLISEKILYDKYYNQVLNKEIIMNIQSKSVDKTAIESAKLKNTHGDRQKS